MGNKRANKSDKEKIIYQAGLLLRYKTRPIVVRLISEKWGVKIRQARNYIRLAEKEWQKYFEKLKIDGMSYHVAQMRDLKDKARSKEDNRLEFDIAKEEAKLMGVYPVERHKVDLPDDLIIKVKLPDDKN